MYVTRPAHRVFDVPENRTLACTTCSAVVGRVTGAAHANTPRLRAGDLRDLVATASLELGRSKL